MRSDDDADQTGPGLIFPSHSPHKSLVGRMCTLTGVTSAVWQSILIGSQIFLFGWASVAYCLAAFGVSGLFVTFIALFYGAVLVQVRSHSTLGCC